MTPGSKSIEASFGVRLRAARKMAGLSMEDLANRLGGMVTKQAIGKYEKGLMMPAPGVLVRLIEVLNEATWGASPLKNYTPEAAESWLLEEPEIRDRLESPAPAPQAFRRQRTPGHLMRRIGELLPHHARKQEPESESAPASKSILGSAADDLASLSERRARYVRGVKDAAATRAAVGASRLETLAAAPVIPDSAPMAQIVYAEASARPYVLTPEDIHFREGQKLSAKSASALRYRLADYFERCLGLESLLGALLSFHNPVANMPVRTVDEVEAAAAEVRRRWDLGSGPIVNLLGCLEDRAIRIFETSGIEGFEGLSGMFGTVPFVAVSRDFPADRIRFTAAHELAHVLCGFPERAGAEGLCHTFAAAFLLPRAAVEKAFAPPRSKVTLGDLVEIKQTFGISLQAIMYRTHALGLVTDRQLRSFRETFNAKGWWTTEPVEYAGVERPTRFRRLIHYAVASGIIPVERAAELRGVPAAELMKEMGEIF